MNNDDINNDKISFSSRKIALKRAISQVIQIIFRTYRGMPLANSIRSFNANTVIEVRTSVISKVSSKGKTTLTAKERFLAEVICRTITRFFFKKKILFV